MDKAWRMGVIGGAGWLGGAMISAILRAGVASPQNLTSSYRRERPTRFNDVYWTENNQELVERSDVIIVSVRPADWPALDLVVGDKLVISVMAGIPLSQLSERSGTRRVVRALPNAAAEVEKSFTPWVASADVTDHDRSIVRAIFEACGSAEEVGNEADIDYLTGLSGSGPAFPALLASAMVRDAVARGFSHDMAQRAVTAVVIGAGRLREARTESPADTVETFLSYRGTTAAAIEAMREAGFEVAVSAGLSAALEKSASMGRAEPRRDGQ